MCEDVESWKINEKYKTFSPGGVERHTLPSLYEGGKQTHYSLVQQPTVS